MSDFPNFSPNPSGESDPLYALEQQLGLSETEALYAIAARYQERVGNESRVKLSFTDETARLVYQGPYALYLETSSDHLKDTIPSISVGHIDKATGNPVFYPELVTPAEATVLASAAAAAHSTERAETLKSFYNGSLIVFRDFEDPIVRQLMQHQRDVLQGSMLAQDIIRRFSETRNFPLDADEATTFNIRFFPQSHGKYGAPDYLSIPQAKVVLETYGLLGKGPLGRYDEFITLATMNGFDPLEGYAPYEAHVREAEYVAYVEPLIEEVRAMQQIHPNLSWDDGPAIIYRR